MSLIPLLLAETNSSWAQAFLDFNQNQRFALLIVAIGCLTAIILAVTGIVAGVYSSVSSRRIEAELKQDMLDRGMSAEEITEVVEATPVSDFADRWVKAKYRNKKQSA